MDNAIVENNTSATEAPVLSPRKKMGRFKASHHLFLQSWQLLKKDKEIVLFPILSIFANILVFAPVAFFIFITGDVSVEDGPSQSMGVGGYVFLFFTYLISYFIASFFQAGLITVVHGRLNGQNLSFKDGFSNAVRHSKKIFVWSLIAATVGVIMNLIFERVKTLGRVVVWVFGALWSVMTFFIVPVLILEDLSPINSIKQSGSIFKKTWGETAIMNISLGLYLFVYYIFGFAAFIALFLLGNIFVILIGAIALVVFIMALMIISSSLNTVFKVVLYEYANKGVVPEGFDPELIQNAMRLK